MAHVNEDQNTIGQRVLGAVDLALDFATLGEYGLEPLPAAGPGREPTGRRTGWEGFATARRGGCASEAEIASRRLRLRELTC